MNRIVIYNSSTGFTKRYAEQLAAQIDGRALPLPEVRPDALRAADVVIFATRAHCGTIDKLKRGVRLLRRSSGRKAILVTGAAPADAEQTVRELWQHNLPKADAGNIPHFYVPAGLCYEKMNRLDRFLMKGLAAMLRSKKNKTAADIQLEQSISASFDLSSPAYLEPIAAWVRDGDTDARHRD